MIKFKYLLFAGQSYYPSGGALDCIGIAQTLGESRAAIEAATPADGYDRGDFWGHIATLDNGELRIVAEWLPGHVIFKCEDGTQHYYEKHNIQRVDSAAQWEVRIDYHTNMEKPEEYTATLDVWLIDGVYHLPVTKAEQVDKLITGEEQGSE